MFANARKEFRYKRLTHWNLKLFFPTKPQDELIPTVCCIAPETCCVEYEWYDKGSDGVHLVRYRLADQEEWQSMPLTESVTVIENLKNEKYYEFQIC